MLEKKTRSLVLFPSLNLGDIELSPWVWSQSHDPMKSLAGQTNFMMPGNLFTQHQIRFIYGPKITFCFQYFFLLCFLGPRYYLIL